jgi:Tol biopolymer transport system component
MQFSVGARLGPYQIQSLLGQGGMGVVYKAIDTRLNRTVALKLLTSGSVAAPQQRRRFMQEAQAASALNHPNIVTIYDVGSSDDSDYIAMEYVQGKTIDALIPARGMKVKEVLRIAIQIAAGLERAHAARIIHRDLKPGNVMVADDGVVKVLDFGVAKLAEPSVIDSDNASTRTVGAETLTGSILGTVAYMSPEQVEAKPLDARSDIFSFGLTLYKMVTGEHPFRHGSSLSTVSSILNDNPKPVSAIRLDVPRDLEKIIARCLRKEPNARWQGMTDLRVALSELLSDLETGDHGPEWASTRLAGPRSTSRRPWIVVGVVLSILLVAGMIGLALLLVKREPEAALRTVPLTSYPGNETQPAFSPDGKQIAFVWDGEAAEKPHIYVKLIDSGSPLRLTGDDDPDCCPVWSPDGIGFIRSSASGRRIFAVPALGGPARKLSEVDARGFDWSPDGKSFVVSTRDSAGDGERLLLIGVDTAERRMLTSPVAKPPFGDHQPEFSPDGATVAFTRSNSTEVSDIYVVPVTGGEPHRLTSDNRQIDGLAWTSDGRSIVFSSSRGGVRGLWRMPAEGHPASAAAERISIAGVNAVAIAISRKGNRLAYAESISDTNIWRMDGPAGTGDHRAVKLIGSTRRDGDAQYSPDGKKIVFASDRSGSPEIWMCDRDGLNPVQLTDFNGPLTGAAQWSPDGRNIAFDSRPQGNPDIYVIAAEGGSPRRLTAGPSIDILATWSKDGRWIYFTSNRTGTFQIWKMPFQGGDAVQVTKTGGVFAQEWNDAKFLYFSKSFYGPGLSRVPVHGGEETSVSETFPKDAAHSWGMSKDGIYFIAPAQPNATSPSVGKYSIQFLDLSSRRTSTFAQLEKRPDLDHPGFSISRDARSMLFTQIDQSGSDIMLVENFR